MGKETSLQQTQEEVKICDSCGWRTDHYSNRYEREQPYTIDEHVMYEHMLPSKAYEKGVA